MKRPGKSSLLSPPLGAGSSASVSTRKIENGFVVTKCTDTGQDYTTTETFYPTRPAVDVSVAPTSNIAKGDTGRVTSSLGQAVSLISTPFSEQGRK